MDYQKAMDLAKQHFEDYEVLTQYIVDLNNAYISAKSYLVAWWGFFFSPIKTSEVSRALHEGSQLHAQTLNRASVYERTDTI